MDNIEQYNKTGYIAPIASRGQCRCLFIKKDGKVVLKKKDYPEENMMVVLRIPWLKF